MIAGKKLRLFHFLFEMLEDPGMAHCVSWVPASAGVFHFSARHKERVAELWGQRKGNRMPMTYQKMSRAMRNYARSGEIIKVKKKLTYQFSLAALSTLQSQHGVKKAARGLKWELNNCLKCVTVIICYSHDILIALVTGGGSN